MAEVLGGVVRLVFVVFKLGSCVQNKQFTLTKYYAKNKEYVKRRSEKRKWLVWLMVIDIGLLSQVETIINDWDDERLAGWAQNLLSSFGALVVAVSPSTAIFSDKVHNSMFSG